MISRRVSNRARAGLVLPVAPPYNLNRTLTCGQLFRWQCTGPIATGIISGHAVRLTQEVGGIRVESPLSPEEITRLRLYLGLDEPLAEIERELCRDPVLRRVVPTMTGIALMRQDPWECLISFIISAFNNIPKVEQSLARLADRFGESPGDSRCPFPTPTRLATATLRELRSCLLGYRAPYVQKVARQVMSGQVDLAAIGRLPYEEARAALLALPGVGDKVADCMLLFAYGKREAFPVDVWVKRVVEQWYFDGRTQTLRQIRAFGVTRFGALAGYAQQHLYHYARTAGRFRRGQTRRSAADPEGFTRRSRTPRPPQSRVDHGGPSSSAAARGGRR